MSIPLILFDQSIESALRTVSFDKAWFYDSDRGEWKTLMKLKTYRGTLSRIFHTMGLWLTVTEDCNLTAAGVVPVTTSIQLSAGWNLVGFPSFNSSFTVSTLNAAIDAGRVEGFDLFGSPFHLRVLEDWEVLQAGYGYWIRAASDDTWIVDSF